MPKGNHVFNHYDKTVDNALQRVKRKVGAHLNERAIAA